MSDERDELARELFIADNFNQPREQSIVDWQWFMETPRFAVRIERYKAMAEGVITAGYRKPRQITTVEELDTLHGSTVLRDDNGQLFEQNWMLATPYATWWECLSDADNPRRRPMLPATVLYEPLP